MTPKQKDLLNPFAWTLRLWEQLIVRMSDAELLELRDACKAPTHTNCWYHIAAAAPIVLKFVVEERAQRAEKARRKQ